MGTQLKDLVVKKQIAIENLVGKKIAIDTHNILYQFLAAIRQRDGTLLKDSHGNVTSHLAGLFYRTLHMLEAGIKPCFVFDGEPPSLKATTSAKRREIREEAERKYLEAKKRGDFEAARRYAQQSSRLTPEMIKESKELISALGLPWVQAISDGEAQAAYMASKGQVYAVASQDYDSLLFGAPRLIRNLTITGRKKIANKQIYSKISIELLDLVEILNTLKIDLKQFVNVAILIGTDFNEGVKGLGPKTALKVIQSGEFDKYATNIPRLKQVQNIFLNPAVTSNYTLSWGDINEKRVKKLLCWAHDFSEHRVDSALKKVFNLKKQKSQTRLINF